MDRFDSVEEEGGRRDVEGVPLLAARVEAFELDGKPKRLPTGVASSPSREAGRYEPSGPVPLRDDEAKAAFDGDGARLGILLLGPGIALRLRSMTNTRIAQPVMVRRGGAKMRSERSVCPLGERVR